MSTRRKLPHNERLRRLAEIIIKIGLNPSPSPGQQLLLTSPIEAVDFARLVAAEAYKAGVSLVTPIIRDDSITRARYQFGSDVSFDTAAGWFWEGVANGFGNHNVVRLGILGDNPDLLTEFDPEKVRRAKQSHAKAYYPAIKHITDMTINWTLVAAATPTWAKAVFPHLSERQAVKALWDAIFSVTRVLRRRHSARFFA
jgi:aminopeptidase